MARPSLTVLMTFSIVPKTLIVILLVFDRNRFFERLQRDFSLFVLPRHTP